MQELNVHCEHALLCFTYDKFTETICRFNIMPFYYLFGEQVEHFAEIGLWIINFNATAFKF